MAKLKSTLPNMLLSLTGICLIAGAILAGVNEFTAGPIAVAKAAALEEAIKAVAPEFDNKPTEEAYMAVTADGWRDRRRCRREQHAEGLRWRDQGDRRL